MSETPVTRPARQKLSFTLAEEESTRIVTAKHVDTKLNLADRLTKGLSHVARQALDREMDEIRKRLISRAGAI